MNIRGFSYKIYTRTFPDGDDCKVIFGVKKIDCDEIIYFSALELYQNDALLEKFSPTDIRDIVFTAAWEMFLFEKKMLSNLKNKFLQ